MGLLDFPDFPYADRTGFSESWNSLINYVKRDNNSNEDDEMLQTNNPDELKGHLRNLKVLIKRQIEESRKLSSPPFIFGLVIAVNTINSKDPVAIILQGGRLLEVYLPKDKEIFPGATVKVSSQTMQIIDTAQAYPFGDIGLVRTIIDEKTSEISYNNGKRVVLNGALTGKISVGDRVVLDSSASVIVMTLGKAEQRFIYGCESDITWDDIGGQEEAKEKLREALELPYTEKELFSYYKKKMPKGFLLAGRPGCGKTMLIKAAANSMAKMHGDKAKTGFILVNGAQILEPLVGVAEQTLEQIFVAGEEHYKNTGFPAILAFDEADALLRKRGSGKSSDVEDKLISVFLSQVNDSHSIVMLATNRPDILDDAVTRDKRINHVIQIGAPDMESGKIIAKLNLKDVPLSEGGIDEMAEFVSSELFSPKQVLYDVTKTDGTRLTINLSHIINGAMIAGTVDDAVSSAMNRDRKLKTQTGVTKEDVSKAVAGKVKAQLLLDHTSDISAFVKDFVDEVTSVTQRQIQ